jgi:hypothetical protein
MTRPRAIRGDDLRRALAQEAARLMFEHGVVDYGFAKRKAAERLGVGEHAALPKNAEIDAALAEYQRLFALDTHDDTLNEQRHVALEAMRVLADFEPRLVGPVLLGTATPHQDIALHVFSETPEAVSLCLLDARITYKVSEQRIKMSADRALNYPSVVFERHGFDVQATIFPSDGIRQSPLSPSDGRPMRRATLAEVTSLLAASRL